MPITTTGTEGTSTYTSTPDGRAPNGLRWLPHGERPTTTWAWLLRPGGDVTAVPEVAYEMFEALRGHHFAPVLDDERLAADLAAAILRADAADANGATLAAALMKVCDAAGPHMPQTKIATRTPLSDAVGEAIHAIRLDRQHREGRNPAVEARDAARAVARVLAHAHQTGNDPPRHMVDEALAYPVIPVRGRDLLAERATRAEREASAARVQARRAAAAEESLRAAVEEALDERDPIAAVRRVLDGEEVTAASLELLERFQALGQQVEDLTRRAERAEARAVAAEEERDRLRRARYDLGGTVHLDADSDGAGGWMLYEGDVRVAWFADLRGFVEDVLTPGSGACEVVSGVVHRGAVVVRP